MSITVFVEDGNSVFLKRIVENIRNEHNFPVVLKSEQNLPALTYLSKNQPDIFIYDVDTNDEQNGFTFLRKIRETCSKRLQIIAISDNENVGIFLSFFHSGGAGFVLRVSAEEEIATAARTVSRDCFFLSCRLQNKLLKNILLLSPPLEPEYIASLSKREREVLAKIQKGHSITEIADFLSLSPETIGNNKKSIMKKLCVHTITDLRIKILFADLS